MRKDIQGTKVVFDVCDNIGPIAEKKQCDRVVAVFSSGSQYQFSKWPGADNLANFFTKHRGYFMHYSNIPLNDYVKKCNLKVIDIKRETRYTDAFMKEVFWEDLIQFLSKKQTKSS